eukprot:TRINITY_DN2355_c0_g1_i1.p1 TRINITY_DN2355_c0_g1~~TRINITY_DN2355_c0_g1_i1.p1  ORF type:complete len:426 (-),score=59.61 TRINITY_DN2355_c0_g1_i1:85-1299(-)
MLAAATLVQFILASGLLCSDAAIKRSFNGSKHLPWRDDSRGFRYLEQIDIKRESESLIWPWGDAKFLLPGRDVQPPSSPPVVTMEDAFPVSVTKGVVYGQGLVCNNNYTECVPKDLLVDVYDPQMDDTATPRPAMVVVHGGTEQTGSREHDASSLASAEYFSCRGFVVFNIDYRMLLDNGLFSCQESVCQCDPKIPWWRNPCYIYPPVRDYKAAIRWVRANSARFNIDSDRIVSNGGSAGATNILLGGFAAEALYKDELLLEDGTLGSTNLEESSQIRMAVFHWPFTVALDAAIEAFGSEMFSALQIPSVLHFHGTLDTYANVTSASALAEDLRGRGVNYQLVLMEGCAHMAWCGSPYNDGRTCDSVANDAHVIVQNCVCKLRCTRQDEYALPVIAEELDLKLT